MKGAEFAQLQAFAAAAQRCNFREASTYLGIAPSTLSQTIRLLEDRLDVRLFNRTTRSVKLTQAGDMLFQQLRPLLRELERSVEVVSGLSEHETGRVRLVSSHSAARYLFASLVGKFSCEYPDIEVELTIDDTITNIVENDFDAGVRMGYLLEKDMVALPLTPDIPVCVVASPRYLAEHGEPLNPDELQNHRCLRTVHSVSGTVFPWRFRKQGNEIDFVPTSNLTVNDESVVADILAQGAGIGYMLRSDAEPLIQTGELVAILSSWTTILPGFYIYYVHGRHMPAALRLFLDLLKGQRNW